MGHAYHCDLFPKASIDGEEYRASEHIIYNGIMINDVPNMAFIIGYTNASWTLKADIASLFFTKGITMHTYDIRTISSLSAEFMQGAS